MTRDLLAAVLLGYLLAVGPRAPFMALVRWRWRRANRLHFWRPPPAPEPPHGSGHPLNCPRCNPWCGAPTWRTRVRRFAVRALELAAGCNP